eukprot:Gregarina_sp_Pseudo_9__1122@NODE_1733_length_1362_cov_221_969766_g1607_i0_p1_GENE_NODE_1733_length_1362_cov_221_969766_g1607_i0NODE_1733_length_1362_cov_221_969766_g1607_i0_p1_ORF_typecomplete_len392_score51_30Oxidored_FMN/PF00724_20/1_4e101Dus/PF01207_17/6e09DHO_dh/PF01180_21/1_3e05His_biosynth/PF00977_21/2_8e03His_biosynth/PF00977_21/0_00052IMPDH/PF00478_25/1_7e03IMPDH/PF00478_25/0_0018DUF561/PF04481_12/4_3e02DUF561/PF04481_12/0_02PcrB/PF01884_17/2_3e03PcrB/PF01884_17/0_037TMPTENI/PF02581_17/1
MTGDLIQESYALRGVTLPNRCVVPPMCLWLADEGNGLANDRHLVHYGTVAESGVGLIILEATTVQPCGHISPTDLGLYNDAQIAPLKRIVDYIHSHSPSKVAIQLAHAGRKGPFDDPMSPAARHLTASDKYGHQCVSASAIAHAPSFVVPKALNLAEIEQLKKDWASAAQRAVAAGFDAIEIHNAHESLLNQFTSPVSNHRIDAYGGNLENRLRLTLEIVEAIRKVIPESMPFFCRISCVDWVEDGTTIEDSIYFAKELNKRGVDLIHCSSGGVSYKQELTQVLSDATQQIKFAEQIKDATGVPTIAVGGVTSYEVARDVINSGQADLVAVGRAYLKDPYWWRSALVSQNVIPWHPQRQYMGFQKSKRRQEAEKKAMHGEGQQLKQTEVTH